MSASPAWTAGAQPGTLRASASAAGPWSPHRVHGGAVNALLGQLLVGCAPNPRARLVRVTVDLLRAVPLEPLMADTHLLRDGRRYSVADVTLRADSALARAVGLFAERAGDSPAVREPGIGLPAPEDCVAHRDHVDWPTFNNEHLELRLVPDPPEEFALAVWARSRGALVADHDNTSVCDALAASDLLAGLSGGVGPDGHAAMNVDSTVHFERTPRPGWIAIAAYPLVRRSGTPVAEGIVYDELGRVGSVRQSTVLVPV